MVDYFVGLDLSLTESGYAIISPRREVIAHGVIKPKKLTGPRRLQFIRDGVLDIIPEGRIVCVIEGYAMRALGRVYSIGENGGVVRLALFERGDILALETPPLSLKAYATHSGAAEKKNMVQRARVLYGYEGSNDNEADALHAAHLAADWWQRPRLATKQNEALKKTVEVYPPPFVKPVARKRSR